MGQQQIIKPPTRKHPKARSEQPAQAPGMYEYTQFTYWRVVGLRSLLRRRQHVQTMDMMDTQELQVRMAWVWL